MKQLIFLILCILNFNEFYCAKKPSHGISTIIEAIHQKMLGFPDKSVGKKLKNWKPGKQNLEELGSYYQGDLLIPLGKIRNGLIKTAYRWPNAQIPYTISSMFSTSEKANISKAMNDYHANTCIKFVPKTSRHRNFLMIQKTATGCWSSVGMIGGRQLLNYQKECLLSPGTVLHELYHAIGFFHEQSREDRDDFVTINWENIEPGRENNFEKAAAGTTTFYDVPYNYSSMMHYSAFAFSELGLPTITAKQPGGEKMGNRDGFATSDILKVNKMYNCPVGK